jgi:hypothetical protein
MRSNCRPVLVPVPPGVNRGVRLYAGSMASGEGTKALVAGIRDKQPRVRDRMADSLIACLFELCNSSAGPQERKLHPSYRGRRNNEWLATQR